MTTEVPPAYLASTEGEPDFVMLWTMDEIEQINQQYDFEMYRPGLLAFGTDCSRSFLAFDKDGVVYMLLMAGEGPRYAAKIASSWDELVARFKRPA